MNIMAKPDISTLIKKAQSLREEATRLGSSSLIAAYDHTLVRLGEEVVKMVDDNKVTELQLGVKKVRFLVIGME